MSLIVVRGEITCVNMIGCHAKFRLQNITELDVMLHLYLSLCSVNDWQVVFIK